MSACRIGAFRLAIRTPVTNRQSGAGSHTPSSDLADGDYTSASGTVTFPAAGLAQTITVAARGDTILEDHQTFTVKLSNPVGATLGTATDTIMILNDEKPKVTVAAPPKALEGAPVTFQPRLAQRYYQPITATARTTTCTSITVATTPCSMP